MKATRQEVEGGHVRVRGQGGEVSSKGGGGQGMQQ